MNAFLLAILLIFFILVTQFNSISLPFVIMISVLLSFFGVFFGLLVTFKPFGIIMTGIGIISLAGVVVNNAIVLLDYIEKQLDEISDSLSLTEDNLQQFRSSNQLLDISDQATGISNQYLELQNQLAELITRQRYYDYVSEYLSENDTFSNMIVPASMPSSEFHS